MPLPVTLRKGKRAWGSESAWDGSSLGRGDIAGSSCGPSPASCENSTYSLELSASSYTRLTYLTAMALLEGLGKNITGGRKFRMGED